MSKQSQHLRLGAELLAHRLHACISQVEMARRVGVSVPTVRLAESGRGILLGFMKIAAKMHLVLDSDALPSAPSFGTSLHLLRKRLGISRRALADRTSVPLPTLAALEAGRDCRMASMGKVAGALGVGLRLRQSTVPKAFYSGASKSSVHQAWTTPAEFLERLYPLVGGVFQLDPCSPTHEPDEAPVRAATYYTEADDGLVLPWSGSVFMNPPYGRDIRRWVAKARQEVDNGAAAVVFGLVPARTDTHWWHESVAHVADVWILRGRLRFGGLDGGVAPFASALVAWGLNDACRDDVHRAFPSSEAWHVAPIGKCGTRTAEAVMRRLEVT